MNEIAIGIDLGTTNSCVAILKNGELKVIENEFNERTTPSMVTICKNGIRLIGKEAKDGQTSYLKNTIYESKRLIGRKYNDNFVQDRKLHWFFKVINDSGNPKILVTLEGNRKKGFKPEEISAMILEKMKTTAEKYLNQKISTAVITVPAYFNNNQRQATIDAAKIAGFNNPKIMNEPTAAAFAYVFNNRISDNCKVLIFDLGGGTLDVSIIQVNGRNLTTIGVGGDTELGGTDFDILLYSEILNIISRQYEQLPTLKKHEKRRLIANCEKVKKQLSESNSAKIDLPLFINNKFDIEYTVTKKEFENIIDQLVRKIMEIVKKTLSDTKESIDTIDYIVLVGGSSRIPFIQKCLREFFNKDLIFAINPDEAVACGAAFQAALLSTTSETSIENVEIIDVIPLSLGIEVDHGFMNIIIKKNTPLPVKHKKRYTTLYDNQTALRITVYQGEHKLTANNTKLGHFDLCGILPALKGALEIWVIFDIDINGVLHITATETSSKETNSLEIRTETGRIPEEELSEIIKENKNYTNKRKLIEEAVKNKNDLMKMCFDAKRTIESTRNISHSDKTAFLQYIEKSIKEIENMATNNEHALEEIHLKEKEVAKTYDKLLQC